jgi:phosphohistidine swiveling domain-containing protein
VTATRTPTWTKPGPGSWELDSSHCGPSPGPLQRAIYEECLEAGMREGLGLFGAPLSHMEMRWVNGKFYRRLVPIVGGDSDRKPPPPAVLKIASRLHPAFRREEKKAKRSFETKAWRAELHRWETEWKPSIIATNERFTAVDVAALSDTELADHIDEVWEHLRWTGALHFRLHVSDMGPLGMLMVHLEDWGLKRDDTFRALVAASPATREPAMKLRELAKAAPDATSLDDYRAAAPELLDAYLGEHGWRLTTGYDIEDRCLAELPDVLLASIRAAANRGDAAHDADGALAALRDQVPAEHRATFDEAVEDARLSYGLRDENGPLTYEWPMGLLRRAVLEAARRLPLAAERDIFELSEAEITAWLRGGAGVPLDDIAARAELRRWEATLVAPETLGEDTGPPPVDVLPENLARITRIVLTVVETLEANKSAAALTGMGIGTAPYVGTARVVSDAVEALATMEPGDVVVAPYTAPTYNAVLSMAGAIVTEQGGLLCHAAVIARELELPAVIGCANAMSAIPDGATVEVDPVAGRVRVL